MTKWKHECDLDWLRARQQFLTATDIKDLLPFTKTGRKRDIDDATYMKVMSRKLCMLTEADCKSYGAAARGHILEPFAIDMFNRRYRWESLTINHWDDCIVTRSGSVEEYGLTLAFSPDGLDCTQPSSVVTQGIEPTVIAEVKSYGADKHYVTAITDKKEIEERWQIATAMVVCPTIKRAYLLLFNPSVADKLFIHSYDRKDLLGEIAVIEQIEKDWLDWIGNNFLNLPYAELCSDPKVTEEAIVDKIVLDELALPEPLKTVFKDA